MATPQVLEMLAHDPLSKAIRQVFQSCQDDSVSCGKSVSRFRKIYSQCETDKEKKSFFKKFIFYLQLPLTAKERSHYVDECLEVSCKLVASYLEDGKEKEKPPPEKEKVNKISTNNEHTTCLLYTSPSPRDRQKSRMPSSA